MNHPYKINTKIKNFGTITDICQTDNGDYQYEIDKEWYHQAIIDEYRVRSLSFDKFRTLAGDVFLGNNKNLTLLKAAHLFLCTDIANVKFKKYDNTIVSRFNWMRSNIGTAYSHLLKGI